MVSLRRFTRQIRTFTVSSVCLVALVCTGCGYDPKDPAYDTAANSSEFPQKAIDLLDNIESGTLRTYDGITAGFGDLYLAHPVLLGDPDWNEVVKRVGRRLEYRAGELVRDGWRQYGQAAEYYLTAAQIHLEDTALADRAALFGVWKSSGTNPAFDFDQATDSGGRPELETTVAMLTRFALTDRQHFRFAREFLARSLLGDGVADRPELEAFAGDRSVADRALLAALGLIEAAFDNTIATFREPAIDLVAYRLTPTNEHEYRMEMYFLPHERVDREITVAFSVETPDSVLPADRQPVFPYDFPTVRNSTEWEPGEIVVGFRSFYFEWPISACLLGLKVDNDIIPVVSSEGDNDHIRVPQPTGN